MEWEWKPNFLNPAEHSFCTKKDVPVTKPYVLESATWYILVRDGLTIMNLPHWQSREPLDDNTVWRYSFQLKKCTKSQESSTTFLAWTRNSLCHLLSYFMTSSQKFYICERGDHRSQVTVSSQTWQQWATAGASSSNAWFRIVPSKEGHVRITACH